MHFLAQLALYQGHFVYHRGFVTNIKVNQEFFKKNICREITALRSRVKYIQDGPYNIESKLSLDLQQLHKPRPQKEKKNRWFIPYFLLLFQPLPTLPSSDNHFLFKIASPPPQVHLHSARFLHLPNALSKICTDLSRSHSS